VIDLSEPGYPMKAVCTPQVKFPAPYLDECTNVSLLTHRFRTLWKGAVRNFIKKYRPVSSKQHRAHKMSRSSCMKIEVALWLFVPKRRAMTLPSLINAPPDKPHRRRRERCCGVLHRCA
jgi:hypothetical protein